MPEEIGYTSPGPYPSVTDFKGFRPVGRHTVLPSRGWNMLRISKIVLAVVLSGIGAMASAETVYKWVDGSGQVHYTDLPPKQGDARVLGVYQQESGDVEGDEPGDDASGAGDDDAGAGSDDSTPDTAEPPPSEEARIAAANDAAKAQVENCKKAQDKYQRYIDSRRLYRPTPDGKRVYLTDQELADARARAKQEVDDLCS
jgi:hypothetical protein